MLNNSSTLDKPLEELMGLWNMKALSVSQLRNICPVKWHDNIPEDGISLGVADVDFDGPEGIVDHIKSNLTKNFSFYQNQQGMANAITSAKNHLIGKNVPVKEDQIQIIEGTMIGIYIAMKWISKQPGDLLVLGPIYEPIHNHASSTSNKLHWSSITNQGFDREKIKEQISEKNIKMITMCNPSNPTGYVYSQDDLKFIRDLVIDYNLYVFSDELYEPLWFDRKHTSVASIDGLENRSIMLYGFSKAYGLAGYRSGFMYMGMATENLKYIASQQMVSPSPIASLVTEYALNNQNAINWVQEFRAQSRQTTLYAAKLFRDTGFDCDDPMGGFFVYPDLRINDTEFTQFLLEKFGVQVVPGSKFGPAGQDHIRINCATSIDRLHEGVSRIINAVGDFEKEKN